MCHKPPVLDIARIVLEVLTLVRCNHRMFQQLCMCTVQVNKHYSHRRHVLSISMNEKDQMDEIHIPQVPKIISN